MKNITEMTDLEIVHRLAELDPREYDLTAVQELERASLLRERHLRNITDSAEGRVRGQHRDESLVGGKYHGPSNVAGLTAREYGESSRAWEDEQERLRDEW